MTASLFALKVAFLTSSQYPDEVKNAEAIIRELKGRK
jgi:hypothetical protein